MKKMKNVKIYYVIQMSWPKCENVVYVKDINAKEICLNYNDAEKFDDIDIAEDATKVAFKWISKKGDEPFFIQPVMVRETFEIIDPYIKI